MAREDLHFRLRIPEDLKARIEEASAKNRRSMTAEIVDRLEDSFSTWPRVTLPKDEFDRAMRFAPAVRESYESALNQTATEYFDTFFPKESDSFVNLIHAVESFMANIPDEEKPPIRRALNTVFGYTMKNMPDEKKKIIEDQLKKAQGILSFE